ncbi:MAG: sulfotransferase domain-containing protein [Bacteroidetes bacterium]|nr:sulfotransferase domain-containing protein [Bacteroidota bacterium]
MSWEISIIEKCIRFLSKVKSNVEGAIHQLRFMKYELLFGERDDDIYVVTFLKAGTTWMQMILYQLTTDGAMNFKHIYDVSPWLRNLADRNGTIPDLLSPRIVKTHDPYNKVDKNKKGKYIFVVRDGLDVANSLYHHRKNYNSTKITFQESFEMSFRDEDDSNWFKFHEQWLRNKNKLPILYVRYEDLQQNFVQELFRIAKFLGIELKPEHINRIQEHCSFDFMKQHESKFGEQPNVEKHEIVYNQFIRTGKMGEGEKVISEADKEYFYKRFNFHLGQFPIMEIYKRNQSPTDK